MPFMLSANSWNTFLLVNFLFFSCCFTLLPDLTGKYIYKCIMSISYCVLIILHTPDSAKTLKQELIGITKGMYQQQKAGDQ